jgi:hypothetical protein
MPARQVAPVGAGDQQVRELPQATLLQVVRLQQGLLRVARENHHALAGAANGRSYRRQHAGMGKRLAAGEGHPFGIVTIQYPTDHRFDRRRLTARELPELGVETPRTTKRATLHPEHGTTSWPVGSRTGQKGGQRN